MEMALDRMPTATDMSQPPYRRSLWLVIDKLGVLGAILTALASPCCFPLLAGIGGVLGLGSIPFMRAHSGIWIQGMTVLTILGQIAAHRRHRHRGPLSISVFSGLLVFYAYHANYQADFIYLALIGLTIAAVWNFMMVDRSASSCCAGTQRPVVLVSVLTCPNCGQESRELMPTDACLFFFDCPACGKRLKPKPGDCCVFCS